jgi:hypothetical protein
VPGKSKGDYRVNIFIESLTEYFYPMIYLKKQELEQQPTQLNQLLFPSIKFYDKVYGQNPFENLNRQNFLFTFPGTSTYDWCYYTMAVYEHNWGLTEVRKSEY